jgi:perosamine synthetase
MDELFQQIVDFIRELYLKPGGVIPLHAPIFNGNEVKYLEECIDSTYVSSVGRFVDQFEVEIAKYTGAKKAVACVNGTSALHLALKLVGVVPGDEVITQPLTFVATANAITYCGAIPLFLDVDIDTLGLSPVKLETWLKQNIIFKKRETQNSKPGTLNSEPFNKFTGHRISACVPMHTFGHPCRIDEIIGICNRYNIPIVEDAAESLGSFYKEKHTGTFGKIGVLSFNGNKILTSGGGGMLLFMDEELAKHAKHLTTQSKIPHSWEFVHDEIGYNYRMPNINAALGLAQLEQLPDFLKSKRKIGQAYMEFFSTFHQFNNSTLQPFNSSTNHSVSPQFITEPKNAQSNYWLNCILFRTKADRDNFLEYTNERGVITRPAWQLMNDLLMFAHCQTDDLINSKELAKRLVNIPSSVIKYNS